MLRCLLYISLLLHTTLAQHPGGNNPDEPQEPQPQGLEVPQKAGKKWPTLSGELPLVVARGGLSGVFPESSNFANIMAMEHSLGPVALLCDLQMTKDGIGICQPDVRLQNSTTISMLFPNEQKTYNVNGLPLQGWFAVDYLSDVILGNVTLVQNIFSRPNVYDGLLPVSTVEDISGAKAPVFWLNVQYEAFYTEHRASPLAYLNKALRLMDINYISSSDIGFLKALKVDPLKTKLMLVFREPEAIEPSTRQPYRSVLQNLKAIKQFASGIIVPKTYIWPVGPNKYLGPPTTLVNDAHRAGLEVFASGFANDMPASYNYSYDPVAEYETFFYHPDFTVDGVITDFANTASETLGCFGNDNMNNNRTGKTLIITHNGASGNYPGCTDLAYEQAITDGATIIDCSVQMSKDGKAFCLDTADLTGKTNAMTTFMSRSSSIPEIQKENGIFSFDLSWDEIKTLKPQIVSPFMKIEGYPRNPAAQNQGKLMTLAEFLELAKAKPVAGILINIENAPYLASKKSLDIVGAVTAALSNASFDKQSTKQVLIESDDSSVLDKFAGIPSYKRVLQIKNVINNAPKEIVEVTKKHADAVAVTRQSIVRDDKGYAKYMTSVVEDFHAGNISVYVGVLRNEYVSLAFDYMSDPYVELATYIGYAGVDGIITEFPATTVKYLRSPCSNQKAEVAILPCEPNGLLSIVPKEAQPPAVSPAPPLDMDDVVDPPLPALGMGSSDDGSDKAPASGSSRTKLNMCSLGLSLLIAFLYMGLQHGN